MPNTASAVLAPWSNFYVITGTAAASLTGLMFVVITLVAGVDRSQRRSDGIATFSTPTVVHFCVAFLLAATLSAPWRSLAHTALVIGATGLGGTVYVLRILYLTMRQSAYRPELEDWVWYSAFPLLAYAAILASAFLLALATSASLVIIGGCTVLLIFVGIRNAWDVVTYIAVGNLDGAPGGARGDDSG